VDPISVARLGFGALCLGHDIDDPTAVEAGEPFTPQPGAGSEWEYVGSIVAMAGSTLVYLAAISVFLAAFAHRDSKG
jgi:hypothetical protein